MASGQAKRAESRAEKSAGSSTESSAPLAISNRQPLTPNRPRIPFACHSCP